MALAYEAQPSQEQLSDEQEKAYRAEKLVRMLKAEEEDAIGSQTERQGQQKEALDRYFGAPYGDEEEGRSQVRTREVFETIEWQRNDYARILNDGGKLIEVEETREEYAKHARAAEDYLQFILTKDNPGFHLLDDFTFDGLLHRRGYIAAYWRDKEYNAPELLTGLNMNQVMELQSDPELEIQGQDFESSDGISLTVQRLKSPGRVEIVTFAPEDVRFSGRTVDIDKGRYLGLVWRKLRGEIAQQFPEKAGEIFDIAAPDETSSGFVRTADDVRATRFRDGEPEWNDQSDAASEEMELLEEYLRVDLNGDGYPELIRAYRLGDLLLEEGEVVENPLGTWANIRIPHRFEGLSTHDTTEDLQRVGTVLMRAGLDAVYQSVVNREAFDKNKIEVDGAINSTYTGTKIPVDGSPADAIMPLVGGLPTAQVAWEALEINSRRLEDRTGATRQTRGLDADQFSKEHSGKALGMLQMSADARKEMTARNLAFGLSLFVAKIYRLVCRHQNEPRQVKIGGKYCTFDPRTWNSSLTVSFHVAGLNREHSLMGLQLIAQEQEKVIEVLGPGNPNVTVKNRYRYQEELCRWAGQRDTAAFFTEVPDELEMGPDGQPVMDEQTGEPKTKPWAPPPQEDPQMAKVKADAQAKQAQTQIDAQAKQAQMQLDAQAKQQDAQLQAAKAEQDLQLQREKAAAEIQLAREKAAAEINLAREKAAAEMDLAREQMAMEHELEKERIASQERVGLKAAESKAELSKNRSGGSLSE